MKSIQKITRVQLKASHKDDFILFGIVSAEPDYKLSLTLNQNFKISLRNISPVKIANSNGEEFSFSRFSHSSGPKYSTFNLISNRTDTNILIKKLKNIDYIFQIQDADMETDITSFAAKLRNIETITAVFIIDMSIIKDKNFHYLIE